MSSEKQAKAIRLNAEKSTGPNTNEGKAVATKYATNYGILSTETLLPWENELDLITLRKRLKDSLQPRGELENLLVDRIVTLTLR